MGEMGVWEREPPQVRIPYSDQGVMGDAETGFFTPFAMWGNYFVRDGDRVYIYGAWLRAQLDHRLLVARVNDVQSVDDLLAFENWEFWEGNSWLKRDPTHPLAVFAGQATAQSNSPPMPTGEFSVVRIPASGGPANRWALVYGLDAVHVAVAPNAWGPFVEVARHDLRACNYFDYDEDEKLVNAYGIKAHEHLSDDHDLLVSFILNPIVPGAVLEDPSRYVPRFLKIPWASILRPSIWDSAISRPRLRP